MNVVNDGSGGRGLRSSTRLDQERLKTTNNVGGDKFRKDMIMTVLKIVYGLFQGEDGGAGSKVMAEMSYSGRVSS